MYSDHLHACHLPPFCLSQVEENKAKLADMDAKFADSEGKLHPGSCTSQPACLLACLLACSLACLFAVCLRFCAFPDRS